MRSRRRFYDAAKMQALMAYLEETEAKVCNCAKCEKLLLAVASWDALMKKPTPVGVTLAEPVAGRDKNGRPHCKKCGEGINVD